MSHPAVHHEVSPPRARNSHSEPGRSAPGVPVLPRIRLAAYAAALAIIWLLLLPAAARIPAIREMIARHESNGVDPSAKFYSELPAMPMISARVDQLRQADPEAFGLSGGLAASEPRPFTAKFAEFWREMPRVASTPRQEGRRPGKPPLDAPRQIR